MTFSGRRRSWRIRLLRFALPSAGLLLLPLLAAACAAGTESGERFQPKPVERGPDVAIVIPPEAPVVVGVSSALTGPVGPRGSEYRDAVVVGVNRWKEVNGEEIAGHEIVVHAEDDGCAEADITVGATERLLGREGLVGVLGPQCSGGAEAVIPIYNEAGVVAISGSATRTDLTLRENDDGFFLRTAFTNSFQGELIGQFIAELGAESAIVVDDGDPYATDLSQSSASVLSANGVDVVIVTVPQGRVDFSALATEISEKNPDFVGYAGFNPEAALFYRQLRDAGYAGPFGSGDAAASERDFVGPVGADLAEGVYFSGCSLELPQDFVTEFARVRGEAPTAAFVSHYADAATMLLTTVAEVAEPQSDGSLVIEPARLRDALRATTLAGGFSGRIAFDENGDRSTAASTIEERASDLGLAACQVQNGRLVVTFPQVEQ